MKPYLYNRLIRHEEFYSVITPDNFIKNIPICCPICKLMMNNDDEDSYNKYECCYGDHQTKK